jgi:predicted AAA+ superfamily ATPase
MYPFSFAEFLMACGKSSLLHEIRQASPGKPLLDPIHDKAKELLKKFLVIGGMPGAVAAFVGNNDLRECQYVLDDLIVSLKADFSKYKAKVPELRIATVFEAVVHQMGGKFTYSKIGQAYSHRQLKEGMDLLQMAGLVIPVTHTSANGIPLGAQINPKMQKMLLLDTGIYQRLQGLSLPDIFLNDDLTLVNKGSIAELYAGLEILKTGDWHTQQSLYYWQREALNSNAEVDYVIQHEGRIIPVEIKAGTKGGMQSLHLFIAEKKPVCAIRSSLENFSVYGAIHVYPLYALSNFVKSHSGHPIE